MPEGEERQAGNAEREKVSVAAEEEERRRAGGVAQWEGKRLAFTEVESSMPSTLPTPPRKGKEEKGKDHEEPMKKGEQCMKRERKGLTSVRFGSFHIWTRRRNKRVSARVLKVRQGRLLFLL